jgi:ABC-2 type transport system ATP-binding protein
MTSAISTTNLSKDYGSGRGLFDLDLEVQAGEIFGYLGPNGAGKTTTIKLLMAMIHPSAGSARVLGMDAQREAVAVKRRVGYQPGELPQFGGLRGREVVSYLGGLRGGVDAGRVKELASASASTRGATSRSWPSCWPSCTGPTCWCSTSRAEASTR